MPRCVNMTKVQYSLKNGTHRLSVKGHSGYAECGRDIVCAGVSTLTQALAATLSANRGSLLSLDIESGENTASITIAAAPITGCESYVSALFSMTLHGMELLSSAYPENVNLNVNLKTIEFAVGK